MLVLWWLYLGFTAYGSLYPFDFCFAQACHAHVEPFAPLTQQMGDILANIALFVPAGALGCWVGRDGAASPFRRLVRVIAFTLVALAWAALLQVAQLYLPSRIPSSGDAFWNAIGLAAGTVAALPLAAPGWLRPACWRSRLDRRAAFLLLLAAAWPAVRLAPFAPTAEMSEIRANVGRVLMRPELSVSTVGLATAGFLVTLWATAAVGLPRRLGLLIVPATLWVQIFTRGRALEAWDVVGGAVALLLWLLLNRRPPPGRGTLLSRLPVPAGGGR